MIQTTDNVSVPITREAVLKDVRAHFENKQEQTNRMIDLLFDGWNAIDVLASVFGNEMTQRYLQAGFGEEGAGE